MTSALDRVAGQMLVVVGLRGLNDPRADDACREFLDLAGGIERGCLIAAAAGLFVEALPEFTLSKLRLRFGIMPTSI